MSETRQLTIYEKLLGIQSELKAPKKKTNEFNNYKYRTIESIFEAVKPLLKDNHMTLKLSDELVQIGDRYYVKSTAELINVDLTTEKFTHESICSVAYAREPLTKKGTDESQITGAATTYARKYALTGLFLLDNSENDPDSNEYQKNVRKNTSKAEQKIEEDPERLAAYEEFKGICSNNGLSAAHVAKDLGLSGKSTKEEFRAVCEELKKLIDTKQDLSKWRA